MNVAAAAALRIAKVGFLGDSILREAIISYFLAHQRAPALCPPNYPRFGKFSWIEPVILRGDIACAGKPT